MSDAIDLVRWKRTCRTFW